VLLNNSHRDRIMKFNILFRPAIWWRLFYTCLNNGIKEIVNMTFMRRINLLSNE